MRIIDKKHDFYDYLQDPTDTLVFDRRKSFMLTKELFCQGLRGDIESKYRFVVMQAGVTYWLFLITIVRSSDIWGSNRISDYSIELLHHWKNYNKKPELISIFPVEFYHHYDLSLREGYRKDYSVSKIKKNVPKLVEEINRNNVVFGRLINRYTQYKDYKDSFVSEKLDIPILAPCGIGGCVNPEDLFYAIEEYYSMKKTESEKTVAEGTTELDKITSHGFDIKTSFRG